MLIGAQVMRPRSVLYYVLFASIVFSIHVDFNFSITSYLATFKLNFLAVSHFQIGESINSVPGVLTFPPAPSPDKLADFRVFLQGILQRGWDTHFSNVEGKVKYNFRSLIALGIYSTAEIFLPASHKDAAGQAYPAQDSSKVDLNALKLLNPQFPSAESDLILEDAKSDLFKKPSTHLYFQTQLRVAVDKMMKDNPNYGRRYKMCDKGHPTGGSPGTSNAAVAQVSTGSPIPNQVVEVFVSEDLDPPLAPTVDSNDSVLDGVAAHSPSPRLSTSSLVADYPNDDDFAWTAGSEFPPATPISTGVSDPKSPADVSLQEVPPSPKTLDPVPPPVSPAMSVPKVRGTSFFTRAKHVVFVLAFIYLLWGADDLVATGRATFEFFNDNATRFCALITTAATLRIATVRFWHHNGLWYYFPVGLAFLAAYMSPTTAQPLSSHVWELQTPGGIIPALSALDHRACIMLATSALPVNTHYLWCGDTGANRTIAGDLNDFVPGSLKPADITITVAKAGISMKATAVGECHLHTLIRMDVLVS